MSESLSKFPKNLLIATFLLRSRGPRGLIEGITWFFALMRNSASGFPTCTRWAQSYRRPLQGHPLPSRPPEPGSEGIISSRLQPCGYAALTKEQFL